MNPSDPLTLGDAAAHRHHGSESASWDGVVLLLCPMAYPAPACIDSCRSRCTCCGEGRMGDLDMSRELGGGFWLPSSRILPSKSSGKTRGATRAPSERRFRGVPFHWWFLVRVLAKPFLFWFESSPFPRSSPHRHVPDGDADDSSRHTGKAPFVKYTVDGLGSYFFVRGRSNRKVDGRFEKQKSSFFFFFFRSGRTNETALPMWDAR